MFGVVENSLLGKCWELMRESELPVVVSQRCGYDLEIVDDFEGRWFHEDRRIQDEKEIVAPSTAPFVLSR
jgi:hypothetical protein